MMFQRFAIFMSQATISFSYNIFLLCPPLLSTGGVHPHEPTKHSPCFRATCYKKVQGKFCIGHFPKTIFLFIHQNYLFLVVHKIISNLSIPPTVILRSLPTSQLSIEAYIWFP